MPRFEQEHSTGYRIAVGSLKYVIRIFLLVLFATIVIYAGRMLYSLGYEAFSATALDDRDGIEVEVTITQDMNSAQIANLLNKKGLIRESSAAYILQEYVYGYHNKILPGTYTLSTSMTVEEMMEIMSAPAEEEQE